MIIIIMIIIIIITIIIITMKKDINMNDTLKINQKVYQ